MGYETRMYIGRPYLGEAESHVQIEGERSAYHIYKGKEDKKGDFFYLSDGNTKRYMSGLKRQRIKYQIVEAQIMQIIAMVDLCKACYGEMAKVIAKGNLADGVGGGFYDSGGNSHIIQDSYGEFMTFVDPKEVLEAMKKDHKVDAYRRFDIAIPALRNAIKVFKGENLQVLFFGY